MSILASVVVPTYKRPDLLDRCLAALFTQDFNPANYEILVVDDAASSETRQQISTWAERATGFALLPTPSMTGDTIPSDNSMRLPQTQPRIRDRLVPVSSAPVLRYVPVDGEHGPAAARNAGWQAAAGEVIAFTDDDTIPDPGWLKAGVAAFSLGVAGASGRVIMPLPEDPTDYERDASGLARSQFVTANCFYLRSALEAAGGFDTRFKLAWREDTDLFFTLLEMGYALVQAPEAIVHHPIRPAQWGISLRQQNKSQYNALLFQKHPRLYRKLIQPSPPWKYFLIILGFICATLGAAISASWLAILGTALWAGTSSWFIRRRLAETSRTPGHVLEIIVTSLLIPWLSVYWRERGALRFRVWFF